MSLLFDSRDGRRTEIVGSGSGSLRCSGRSVNKSSWPCFSAMA